jgi:hypothetical protein
MGTKAVTVHVAQVRILADKKRAADAAAMEFAEAVRVVAAGFGITEGTLETLDDETGALVFTVPDPPAESAG